MSRVEELQEYLSKEFDFVYITQQGDEFDISVDGENVWTFSEFEPKRVILLSLLELTGRLEAANDNR